MTPPIHRPARLSAACSTLAALGVVGVLAGSESLLPLGVAAGGLLALAGGTALRERDRRVPGLLLSLLGGVGVVAALPVGVSTAENPGVAVVLVVGTVGSVLVGTALVPVAGRGSRRVLALGAALVLAAVLAAAVVRVAETAALLAGGALTVVAWDAGEHAIGVGEQLGRAARTTPGEAVHVAGTAVVAAVAVAAASAVDGAGSTGLPLPALGLLLVAVGLLTVALYD